MNGSSSSAVTALIDVKIQADSTNTYRKADPVFDESASYSTFTCVMMTVNHLCQLDESAYFHALHLSVSRTNDRLLHICS